MNNNTGDHMLQKMAIMAAKHMIKMGGFTPPLDPKAQMLADTLTAQSNPITEAVYRWLKRNRITVEQFESQDFIPNLISTEILELATNPDEVGDDQFIKLCVGIVSEYSNIASLLIFEAIKK